MPKPKKIYILVTVEPETEMDPHQLAYEAAARLWPLGGLKAEAQVVQVADGQEPETAIELLPEIQDGHQG